MIQPFWNLVRESLKRMYKSDGDCHFSFIQSIPDHMLGSILGHLSLCLQKCTGRDTIILIDEYDAPLNVQFASEEDQENTEKFFSELYSCALKSNTSVINACLVGVAEIRGSNILSVLNNVCVHSLDSLRFSSYFGFTEKEVIDVLISQCGMTKDCAVAEWGKRNGIKDWYNGYHVGDRLLINPWSFTCYLEDMKLQSYWVNTSFANSLFDICRENPSFGEAVAESFPALLAAPENKNKSYNSISVEEFTPYIATRTNNNWSRHTVLHCLCMTGYLTYRAREPAESESEHLVGEVSIPNKELFMAWNDLLYTMSGVEDPNKLIEFYNEHTDAFRNFDSQAITNLIAQAISDLNKRAYKHEYTFHMFLAGMWKAFNSITGWNMKTESGVDTGYADLMIENSKEKFCLIFKFKKSNSVDQSKHEQTALEALAQIQKKSCFITANEDYRVLAIGAVLISNSHSKVPTILLRTVELAPGKSDNRAAELNEAISTGSPTIYVPELSGVSTRTKRHRHT
jgi:hypothetical protein